MMTLGTLLFASAAVASGSIPLVVKQFCQPPEDESLSDSRRTELGLADYLPFEELVEPDLMMCSSGGLGVMYEMAWHDTSVMSDDDRVRHCVQINNTLHKIGQKVGESGWMLHSHMLRVDADSFGLPDYLPNPGRRVLAESHAMHVVSMRSQVRHFVSVAYLPPSLKAKKFQDMLIEGEGAIAATFEKTRAEFAKGLETVEDGLRAAGRLRRLGTHPDNPGRNEFLERIFQVLCDDPQPIAQPVPFEPFSVGGLLAARDIAPAGIRPKIGDKHLRVLSVFGHPSATNPAMLDALLSVPGRFRFSTRLVFQDSEAAKGQLEDKRRKWAGKKTSLIAAAMPGGAQKKADRIADYNEQRVDDAMFLSGTTKISWVHFAAKVVFLNADLEALNEDVRNVRKALQGAGFTANLETVNTLDAYFGHIPFDGYHDVREGMVHTFNASRIWAASSRWGGRKTWTCKQCGPDPKPMFYGLTTTGEDFAVDSHYGDSQSGVIYGVPGTRKSTLLGKIIAEYPRKRSDLVFGIDKGRGLLVATRFLGGDYREASRYWLFANLEDPAKRAFLLSFLTRLCELNRTPVADPGLLKDAIKQLVGDDVWNRSLSTLISLYRPMESDGTSDVLARYASGGAYGGIFDGEYDPHVGNNQREVHELGHFLGGATNVNEAVAAPVVLWVLHTFAERMPGHRSLVLVDEAWAALESDLVAQELKAQIKTMRARHGGVIFATHNIAEVHRSAVGLAINDACKTRFLLPNPAAAKALRGFYGKDGLGLTDPQIEAVANAELGQCALVGEDFGIFDPAYSPTEVAVFGCTGADETAAAVALMEEYPDTWRSRFLAERGCTKDAERIRSLERHRSLSPGSIMEAIA